MYATGVRAGAVGFSVSQILGFSATGVTNGVPYGRGTLSYKMPKNGKCEREGRSNEILMP